MPNWLRQANLASGASLLAIQHESYYRFISPGPRTAIHQDYIATPQKTSRQLKTASTADESRRYESFINNPMNGYSIFHSLHNGTIVYIVRSISKLEMDVNGM